MKANILYGKSSVELDLPDHTVRIEPTDQPALNQPERVIQEALASPIGTPHYQQWLNLIRQ